MSKQRTQYHLIFDRGDATNPRWVIAKEYASRPAEPPELPEGFTLPGGTKWLRGFSYREFDWMKTVLGRESHLRMTPRGEESFSTRISHHTSVWTEYTVPVYPVYCDDTWGADHTDPGWDAPRVPDERDDPDRWADETTD